MGDRIFPIMAWTIIRGRLPFRNLRWHVSYILLCYSLIITSLLTFTILSVLFLYKPTDVQRDSPPSFTTANVTIQQVACALPRSGQFTTAQRWILYFLLVCTIAIAIALGDERGRWLTIGAATSAILNAGVAAIYQILIFHFVLQKIKPWGEPLCYYIPLGRGNTQLPVCYGVDDLDRDSVCLIVGAAMLAALPMTAWSTLMRKGSRMREATKPILVAWVLLMSVSHIFCAINTTDQGVHYQVCPSGVTEPLPGFQYQPPRYDDDVFRVSLIAMISNSTQNGSNSTLPTIPFQQCLYTCFGLQKYRLRQNKDIGVWNTSTPALSHLPSSATRSLGVAFWAIYFGFSIIALCDASDSARNYSARFFGICPCQCHWTHQDIHQWKQFKVFLKRYGLKRTLFRVTLKILRLFPRYLSAGMFLGYIIFLEKSHWHAPESEPFAAVGQWGTMVQILLVVAASLFARAMEQPKPKKEESTETGMKHASTSMICGSESDDRNDAKGQSLEADEDMYGLGY